MRYRAIRSIRIRFSNKLCVTSAVVTVIVVMQLGVKSLSAQEKIRSRRGASTAPTMLKSRQRHWGNWMVGQLAAAAKLPAPGFVPSKSA